MCISYHSLLLSSWLIVLNIRRLFLWSLKEFGLKPGVIGAHCLHPLVAGCNTTICPLSVYLHTHECVSVLTQRQWKNMFPQVGAQYCIPVCGGHPVSAAYPDRDRRKGLQLEVFPSGKCNIVHFSERAGSSLGPEPPGDERGQC